MTGNENKRMLNPRITHFLHNTLGWKKLNEVQESAIPQILNNKNSLIIAPTASGKTEAALIPIYNQIITKHLSPTSVIYIAPLKALINDMKTRIDYWNNHFHLKATKWHGDVTKIVKDNYLREPTDFLLITPESLEVIMINKNTSQKEKIFGNVKYIIIDEIHYFIESERGIQLNSLLTRITKYCNNPVKIGLSATLENPEKVAKWIDIENPAKIIKIRNNNDIRYKICPYHKSIEIPKILEKYISKKILIFCTSRKAVEKYYNIIKHELNIDNIYLHHGSLSKKTREENEKLFKKADSAIMISTNTLELGIDIGNIDIVVQIGLANTVSSLLQRIGRGGRKTKIQRIMFFIKYIDEVIITLAQINLIKNNKIEEIHLRKKAKDIYLHQILSIIFENTNIKIPEVYYLLNKSYVFQKITKDEYREIIQHLTKTDIINIQNRQLCLGYGFEKEFGNINYIDFYSVFSSTTQYTIKNGKEIIGELDPLFITGYTTGDTFILGGKYWTIKKIDTTYYTVYVKKGQAIHNLPNWHKSKYMLDYLITREIYNILLGKYDPKILDLFDTESQEIILELNQYFNILELNENIIPITQETRQEKNHIKIYTFSGDKVNYLLANLIIKDYKINNLIITPTHISFKSSQLNSTQIITLYNNLQENLTKEIDIFIESKINDVVNSKYIEYLPDNIQEEVKKELIFNYNDLKDLLNHTKAKYYDTLNLNILNI